ncbi:nuclear transport factor 2 family protein [Hymenobacter cellulosilyticus]|uniref:Nuclear transport factor 2 family protein n=1 Tax=Hymenobacter cellulosilyticus TaxID=2932248 RepID=A0A8T9Q7U5_9BACT|nr:nuclear transport factor 2 family protein [Hymenobacter cellulosilyticus]UOQ73215.1 nuclear transport factor 2 family protein [Hymenobacter cellulosilyticus]
MKLSESLEIDPAAYATVLHPDVEQVEFPNMLNRTLQRRSFAEILENIRAGRELLVNPLFELQQMQQCPDGSVVIEAHWQATLANDIGPLVRGQQLAAQFCVVFELKDGLIIKQRNYSCFDPF